MALKIKKGDTVQVISGKDSGKTGRVLRVEPKKNRLFVEGLNVPSGEVVWSKGELIGVELLEELSWTSIIPWVRSTVRRGAE